jgi:prepilin-type N-terminal cleavage/methylation domain-containing protein
MRPFLLRSSSGFSLVELMVAMVLSAIAVIAIYRSYVALRVGVDKHEQDVEIHQALRVGMQRMGDELRMAGYDPEVGAEAGFVVAGTTQIRFTADYSRDKDLDKFNVDIDVPPDGVQVDELLYDEDVTYAHVDTDADGTNDALQRTDNNDNAGAGTTQIIIPNVDALRFVYYDGSNPPERLPRPITTGFDRNKIRDIEITLVVRATNEDFAFTNNRVYRSSADEDGDTALDPVFNAPGDNFRRGQMTARIKARNAGL